MEVSMRSAVLILSCSLIVPGAARALDFNVGNSDAYVTALIDIARNPGRTDTLNFTGSFAITATGLPSLAKDAGRSLTVNGNGFAITSSTVRPFFVDSGVVNISNLTVSNALARGGEGGRGFGGGGGGLGAGGAVFVNTGAQVTLDNVQLANNVAQGGNGGTTNFDNFGGGGGGGLGGPGGSGVFSGTGGGGGGGGLYGAGGAASFSPGGGGGGGELGAGGAGFVSGGGGGGRFDAGGGGTNGPGGAGGGAGGGAAGGGSATSPDGGGGGGSVNGFNENGGNAGTYGGGGGAGTTGSGTGQGGAGGRFGGGGGAHGSTGTPGTANGGNSASFGGGGGGNGGSSGGSRGGDGGPDGGGGGGGGRGVRALAGNGGFGAGGGGSGEPSGAGIGGTFGGAGGGPDGFGLRRGGGGGAGLGGAIFVAPGGQLVIRGGAISGNRVIAGLGVGGGRDGQGAGPGIFLRDQSIAFDIVSGTTAALSDSIGGIGANAGVVKMGAGTLVVTGEQTYPGLTTVTAGQLTVNGTLLGAVGVGPGARLSGTGAVGSTTVYGTLAPGNSIGTMTMTGLLVQAASATFEVEVDASGASDRVDVAGTAELGGTVRLLAAPGTYTTGQRFRVISATRGVAGAYASFLDDLAAFNVRALVIGNDVFLELFRAIALTPNQIGVEAALTIGHQRGDADVAAVVAALDAVPEAQARVALDSMAGEIYAALPNAYLQDFSNYSDMVQRRLWTMQRGPQSLAFPREGTGVAQSGGVGGALALAAPMGMPNACDPAAVADSPAGVAAATGNARLPGWRDWTAWGRAHGYEQDIDADGNAARQDIDAQGATFGADRPWGDRAVVGFTAGFTDLDLDIRGRGQSADIDTYRAGVYGTLNLKHHWYATGLASYAHHDVRARRQIAIGTLTRNTGAGFDADGLGLYGEAGRTFHWGKVLLRPHAALRFATVDQDALAEGGAGSLDLRVNSIDQDLFTGIAGLWATRPWVSKGGTHFVPELRLRYLHELESDRRSASAVLAGVPNAPFTVLSNGAGRDAFVAGLGITAKVKDDLAVFASYDGQFHSHADAHAGEAGVRFSW
jgi:outer membrane autotransporter protein